jgi:hypothetical protein
VNVYNGGIGGQTSAQILARYQADTTHQNWTQIFEMGANDGVTYPSTAANIATAVAQAQANSVYYVTSPIQYNMAMTPTNISNAIALTSSLASTYGTHFANWWSGAPIIYGGVTYNSLLNTYNASNPIDVWFHSQSPPLLSQYVRAQFNTYGMTIGAAVTSTTTQSIVLCGLSINDAEVIIDSEDILVEASTGTPNSCGGYTTTSVIRGYAGTTAATHLNGAAWQAWDIIHLNQIGYTVLAAYYAQNLSLHNNAALDVTTSGLMVSQKFQQFLSLPVTFQSNVAVLGSLSMGSSGTGLTLGTTSLQTYGGSALTLNAGGNNVTIGKSDNSGAIVFYGTVTISGLTSTTMNLAWNSSTGGSIQTFASKGLILNGLGNSVAIGNSDNTSNATMYGTIAFPNYVSLSGTRFLCVSTTGQVSASATACTGT